MKKEAVAILLFTMLLSNIVFAELTPDQIYLSDILRISVNESASLFITRGQGVTKLDYINAGLTFFPREEYRQKVEKIYTSPFGLKSANSIDFTWNNPGEQKLVYTVDATLANINEFKKVREKIPFPIKTLPPEVLKFLEPTKNIDSQNPEIVKKAHELARGETDLFIFVSKTALWVKQNINYGLNTMTAEVSESSSWVLKNRIGVCDELASLLIALLRAEGVPAKFVSGLSYSNSPETLENWGPHGWVEVYFPNTGWVPFDPTFGEFGWLDPAHIKMKESADSVDPATKVEWRGKNVNVDLSQLKFNANVLEFGAHITPILKITVNPVKTKVGFGSLNVVEAEVENLKDYYVASEVRLAKIKELESLYGLSKELILKPLEKQKVFWSVKVKPALDDHYFYNVPVLAYTLRNETARSEFSATSTSPQYSAQDFSEFMKQESDNIAEQPSSTITLICKPSKSEYFIGENASIDCIASNFGSKEISPLSVCANEDCKSFSLSQKEQKTISYSLVNQKKGEYTVFITAQSKDFSKKIAASYSVLDVPLLKIENISIEKEISFDEKKRMRFTLAKKSWSSPKKVVVKIEGARMIQQLQFDEVPGDVPFIFVIEGKNLDAGVNKINIQVVYEDENRKKYSINEETRINLINVTSEQKFKIWFRNAAQFLKI